LLTVVAPSATTSSLAGRYQTTYAVAALARTIALPIIAHPRTTPRLGAIGRPDACNSRRATAAFRLTPTAAIAVATSIPVSIAAKYAEYGRPRNRPATNARQTRRAA